MDYIKVVQGAISYIHEKYNENITVADIAGRVYFSPSYFSTVFRTLTGYTVKDYLLRYRLYMSAKQLRDTNKQMFTIAFENGFATQQAFTKSFTQMYETAPSRFRETKQRINKFPPKNLLANKEDNNVPMEFRKIFENVRYVKKDAFFAAGIETDINYSSPNHEGLKSIDWLYGRWHKEERFKNIPDQVNDGLTYGITHEETQYDTAKYMVAVEVSTLDNLPPGYVGRKFKDCEYAVFDCTLEDETSGKFWNYFLTVFLKEQELSQPDAVTTNLGYTFSCYPKFEIYDKSFRDNLSHIQIYAPIVRN